MRTEGSGRMAACSRYGAGPFHLPGALDHPAGLPRWDLVAVGRIRVDLHTAISISMLGVSRLRACAVYKELRQADPRTSLATVLDALGVPEIEWQPLEAGARTRTDVALAETRNAGMDAIA